MCTRGSEARGAAATPAECAQGARGTREGGALHLIVLFAAAVAAGTPLLFAALGELVAERSGVLNLGVEGMMLCGAASGFLVMNSSGSAGVGLLAAVVAGMLLATLHAFFTVTLKLNQVISGLGIAIGGTGLSAIIGNSVVGAPPVSTFHEADVPGLARIPWLGEIFFQHHVLVYVGYVLVPAVWWVLRYTRLGLHLRAVGENPAATDVMGVSVAAYRYGAVAFGGALAGLAGATFSLAESPGWTEGMTAGRGWIAIALVIFATWNPIRVLAGAYFFGTLDALGPWAQANTSWNVNPTLLGMIPYVATILVLIAVTAVEAHKRLGAPEALGTAYVREAR